MGGSMARSVSFLRAAVVGPGHVRTQGHLPRLKCVQNRCFPSWNHIINENNRHYTPASRHCISRLPMALSRYHRSHNAVVGVGQDTNPPHRNIRCRAASDDDDEENEFSIDIDKLAAELSAEAGRLRSEELFSTDTEGIANTGEEERVETSSKPSSPTSKENDDPWDIVKYFGDGGFEPSDFELLQELGQISIQESTDMEENILAPVRRTSKTAVIAFTASYYSGMPFEDPVITLLKEYLPGSRLIACNELRVLIHLCGGIVPMDRKWKVASEFPSKDPPIVQLLGYFVAGSSGRGTQEGDAVVDDNTIWVVLKWDGMAPLSLYPGAQQTSGLGLGRLFGAQEVALQERKRMVKAIMRGMIEALAFVHDRGVAHGSLGSGTFLLSTFNDTESSRLLVKIDGFGFAKLASNASTNSGIPLSVQGALQDDTSTFEELLVVDKRRLALIILECILSSFQIGGPSEVSSIASIERVLGEVYEGDVERYKEYCENESSWEVAMQFLDANDGAGWEVIELLLGGNVSVQRLLDHSFFEI